MRGYLIRKDYVTHMHGLAVCMKEGPLLLRNVCLENSADSYLGFRLALHYSMSYFFFFYGSPSPSSQQL